MSVCCCDCYCFAHFLWEIFVVGFHFLIFYVVYWLKVANLDIYLSMGAGSIAANGNELFLLYH